MHRVAQVAIDEGTQVKCFSPADLAIHVEDQCIVQLDNVLEFGAVTTLEEREGDLPAGEGVPTIVRRATLQDQAKASENALRGKMALETCEAQATKHNLDIRLVRVRFSFDHALLRVMFASEERVDFRQMVKELAGEVRARIEMKQIGVRDEAGIIGGLGPCGRKQCCCTWLRHFESINVKMAKAQRLSLNPSAISGMCGRLKCCLRYEVDQYKESGRGMPYNGARVQCPEGDGLVVDSDILARTVKVRLEDDRVVVYNVNDVRRRHREKGGKRHYEDPGSERAESESAGCQGAGCVRSRHPGQHHGSGQGQGGRT